LFIDRGELSVFRPNDKVFSIRLNENKQLVLQFGDGIYGEKLQFGDEIYPVYLESNGPSGVIGANAMNQNTRGNLFIGILGMTDTMFSEIFATQKLLWVDKLTDIKGMYVVNNAASSTPAVEETVDEIRTNAPNWFKSVGILRSAEEIENFIMRNYSTNIDSVKVMNNWSYIGSFMRWLYNLEKTTGNKYITNDLSTRWDYIWADPADSNNFYTFIKFKRGSFVSTKDIDKKIQQLKVLTAEPIYLNPITKYFVPCAVRDPDYSISDFDPEFENFIEILVDENALVSPEVVRSRVCNTISQFFMSGNNQIGQVMDFDRLHNDIFSITGVKRIRTIYQPKNPTKTLVIKNGFHFIAWSSEIVNGADEDIVSGNYQLESFMFPQYLEPDVSARVKVITDSIVGLTSVEY